MLSRFERLAGWSQRHRWLALAAWIAVLAGVTMAAQVAGADYHNDHSLPGTESQRAADTLSGLGPSQAGEAVQVVVRHPDGVRSAPARERVDPMLAAVRDLPGVSDISSPFDDPAAVSRDGTIAYATATLDGGASDEDVRRMIDTAEAAEGDGLTVALGGDPVRGADESTGPPAEAVGLLAALVILVLLFGSLLAASLPIIIAIFAVDGTIGLIVLASHVATIADYTPPLMILVGLGVGIDYALLVFSRYRSELAAGAEPGRATRTALDTAGRTVFFAGCTVIIALIGLIVLGLGNLQGVAIAVALTVLATMVAALTLLPSLLAIMGGRIERSVRRRAERGRLPDGDRWRRWTATVARRPWPAMLLAVAALLALSAPALGMRLGFADAGTDDPSTNSRQAYDLLAAGFGPGFNGPLVVVASGGTSVGEPLRSTLAGAPGVAATTPPITSPDGSATTIIAFPTSAPQDAGTSELVSRLRSDVLPPLARTTGATILVGGSTAAATDFADVMADRLPLFVAVVVGLSALLLLVLFRSVLIPIKAAVLNLLSVGAAMGAITVVFQNGLLGAQPGPVEAFVPVMIFAIAFGLSMDYEMFLLSRMHEEWERGGDARAAVREGMATTGRIVTAAAAIMVVVFGGFVLSSLRMLNQFGLGLAVAVLLDAVVIRCLIVPAVMELFGARAWWLPGWLNRRVPRLAIERH